MRRFIIGVVAVAVAGNVIAGDTNLIVNGDAEICTAIYGIEDIRVRLEGPFEPGVEFDVLVNGERHGTFVGQG